MFDSKLKSGNSRLKAEYLFRHDFAEGGSTESYACGGRTSKHSGMHKLTRQQTDLHLPRMISSASGSRRFAEGGYADGGELRKGGRARRRADGGEMYQEGGALKKGGRAKYGLGGKILGGLGSFLGDILPFEEGGEVSKADGGAMRKGGRTRRRADGGEMYADGGELRRGGRAHRVRRDIGGPIPVPFYGPSIGRGPQYLSEGGETRADGGALRRGGRARRRAEGGDMYEDGGDVKRASGGTIYERQMLGQHPSRRVPHINYEADMRGEKRRFAEGGYADGGELRRGGRAKRNMGGSFPLNSPYGGILRPSLPDLSSLSNRFADGGAMRKGGRTRRRADGGEMYADGGELRRGGRARRAEGGDMYQDGGDVQTYAMGGAGKIRHGQMSRSGRPLSPRARRN